MKKDKLQELIQKNIERKETVLKKLEFIKADSADILKVTLELESDQSMESLKIDPYWPKWNSPWWKAMLLYEMKLARSIPQKFGIILAQTVNEHYLHFFPYTEQEIPPGKDPCRDIICHCALGSVYSMLNASGLDAGRIIPWSREWFSRYQLPDGGLNCDEKAYTSEKKHSSFLSTLPSLEGVLHQKFGFSGDEIGFLHRGAEYLLQRKLFRSISRGMKVADNSFIRPVFPRFYRYDILRGLLFVTEWALRTRTALRITDIEEPVLLLDSQLDRQGRMGSSSADLKNEGTLFYDQNSWIWKKECELFPLLAEVIRSRSVSPWLTEEWYAAVDYLRQLDELQMILR